MDDMQQGMPPQEQAGPDPNNPDQMIGWIPDQYSAKVKTYLEAAKKIIVRPETGAVVRKLLGSANDPAQALAVFVGKTIDSIETKLGPLTDDEHDQVALVICGWLASSLQAMGMPGMDDAGGRQDLIGRVLTQLDSMQQGGGEQGESPDQQQQEAAPMSQFMPQPGGAPQ